jgi:hypothetical protein
MYRCEATSLEGFVQQLVCYITSGYRWYVTGQIPARKAPSTVDARLIAKYGLEVSKFQRARRKARGEANVQYLRFEQFFVLIATAPMGGHAFFEKEANSLRDIRKQPVRLGGYSVSSRRDGSAERRGHERWRAHVRMDKETLAMVRDFYLDAAVHRNRDELERELARCGWEPYAPIRRQLLGLVRDVNFKRKCAGFDPVRVSCLRFRRRQVKPFEPVAGDESDAA